MRIWRSKVQRMACKNVDDQPLGGGFGSLVRDGSGDIVTLLDWPRAIILREAAAKLPADRRIAIHPRQFTA